MPRPYDVQRILGIAVAAALPLASCAALAHGALRPHSVSEASDTKACSASRVRYDTGGAGVLANIPWVKLGKAGNAYLFFYRTELADGRVNRSSGVVMYTGGATASASIKVLWAPTHPKRVALLKGTQLDGDGEFTERLSASGSTFPSIINVPIAGCWKLTLRTGTRRATMVVHAVDPPTTPVCEPTRLQTTGSNPTGTKLPWLAATPAAAGVTATLFYQLPAGAANAVIYPNEQAPGNGTTKVL